MNNKIKRSTRRAFGRRALAFGVAMFAMVTLTAVGFAAWLISSNSSAEAGGGVVTEQVSQANIRITVDNKNNNGKLVDSNDVEYEIVFAPKSTDTSGLVIFDSNDGSDKPENLSFSFNGSIEHWERVGELNFTVKVPDSVIAAAGLTKNGNNWTYTAANAYIQLPACATDMDGNALPLVTDSGWDQAAMTAPVQFTNISDEGATLSAATVSVTAPAADSATATFLGTFSFGWGARYSFENPATSINGSNWTNLTNAGLTEASTTNDIQLELIKLQAAVNGLNLNGYLADANITLTEGQTLEAYVATNAAGMQDKLNALQEKVVEAINNNGRPQYTLYIQANVR